MSPEEIVRIIRKNVKFEDETDYKKWDSLSMDVRWILREAVKMIEYQEEYIEKMMKEIKGGINMDAVEFLKEWKRFRKEEHRTNCIICRNRDRSVEKRGMCVCNSEENLVDCMIRNIEVVENWSKTHHVIELTDKQKTAIRGRIAEGYNWIARDKSYEDVCFFLEKPYISKFEDNTFKADSGYSFSKSSLYNFVTFENSPIYLPDLLEGEK